MADTPNKCRGIPHKVIVLAWYHILGAIPEVGENLWNYSIFAIRRFLLYFFDSMHFNHARTKLLDAASYKTPKRGDAVSFCMFSRCWNLLFPPRWGHKFSSFKNNVKSHQSCWNRLTDGSSKLERISTNSGTTTQHHKFECQWMAIDSRISPVNALNFQKA